MNKIRKLLNCIFIMIGICFTYQVMHRNISIIRTKEKSSFTIITKSKWQLIREKLLISSKFKKVLLFCYTNGGSTFFGTLFSKHPEAVYWYEPLAAFYYAMRGNHKWSIPSNIFWEEHFNNHTLRLMSKWELESLMGYIHNLYKCNSSGLPIELFTHPLVQASHVPLLKRCLPTKLASNCDQFYQNTWNICSKNDSIRECSYLMKEADYQRTFNQSIDQNILQYLICTNEFRAKYINICSSQYKTDCSRSKLIVSKAMRLTMSAVENLLIQDPDLYVLYFVRDPRAVASSRSIRHFTYHGAYHNPILEAKYLCKKMTEDYLTYKRLNTIYPGAIKLIKYEDLVIDQKANMHEIYNFIGLEPPNSVLDWISYQTVFLNNTDRISKWKSVINNKEDQLNMTRQCLNILQVLNYVKK